MVCKLRVISCVCFGFSCKMIEIAHQVIFEFLKLSIFFQILCLSFSWILLVLTIDCWVSPFVLKGYQLASYLFCLAVISAYLTNKVIQELIKSKYLWENQTLKNLDLKNCRKLSVRDVSGTEVSKLAQDATEAVVNSLYTSEFGNDKDFVKEIRAQVEEIFLLLSEKLSHIEVDFFVKKIIMILHHHLNCYLKAVRLLKNSGGSGDDVNKYFKLSHPVSKGEISVESYLDCLSHSLMKEFIPGSIQDCQSVFDLLCATFCSQFLLKFIHNISQPEVILESLLEGLESLNDDENLIMNDDDFTDHPSSKNEGLPLPEGQDTTDSIEKIPDLLNMSSPNPIGNVVANLESEPCIKKVLGSSMSTVTAPLLPQCEELNLHKAHNGEPQKPNSLPLLEAEENQVEPVNDIIKAEDVSPVYEDVEDFATAIAKLRSLLEQRVSNGSDNSKGSTSFSPTSENKVFGTDGETTNSFEELAEAPEIPSDSRIFLNMKIPRTELCTQQGEGQHSVYCVTYEGIYTMIITPRDANNEDGVGQAKESRLVLKSRLVRRRFHQFLQLHTQFEASENPSVSQAIRMIRGPSKWLNLPFSRLDQNTVVHRQNFLERYMQQLVNSTVLGTSYELRQFLDYELNINETTASPNNASNPRVPFFSRTVSGVLQSIKTALPLPIPGFETDQSHKVLIPLPPPPLSQTDLFHMDRNLSVPETPCSTDEVDNDVKYNVVYSSEMDRLEQLLSTYVYHIDCRVDSAYEAFESNLWRSELDITDNDVLEIKEILEKSMPPKDGWNRFDEDIPLSSSLINLLVACFKCRETWLSKAPIPLFGKIIFGKQMELFFQEQIHQLMSPEKVKENLNLVRLKLQIQNSNTENIPKPIAQFKDVTEMRMKVVELLKRKLPDSAAKFLPNDFSTDVLTMVVSCLTDPLLNRDLSLTILDFAFSQLSSICESTNSSVFSIQ